MDEMKGVETEGRAPGCSAGHDSSVMLVPMNVLMMALYTCKILYARNTKTLAAKTALVLKYYAS